MAKARSGGGLTSNKLVRPSVKAVPASTSKVSPAGVAQLGRPTAFKKDAMVQGRAGQVPLGNQLVTNVGKGGPGTGRQVHYCGSQGTHGAVNRGESPRGEVRGIDTRGRKDQV